MQNAECRTKGRYAPIIIRNFKLCHPEAKPKDLLTLFLKIFAYGSE